MVSVIRYLCSLCALFVLGIVDTFALSVACCLLLVVCYLMCAVCCVTCDVCCVLFVVRCSTVSVRSVLSVV